MMVNFKNKAIGLMVIIAVGLVTSTKAQIKPTIWKFTATDKVGDYTPAIQGAPSVATNGAFTGIAFNGVNDGLIIPASPINGWSRFTIQVLFKPDGDGPKEPRFIHFEDADKNRGTLEVRLTPKRQWYLDAHLKNGKLNKAVTLIDSTQLQPADRWYWVAMVYDGKKMSSYVNGVKQLESPMDFQPMNGGQIAIGMRLNKVAWFKGMVSEARFYPEALAPDQLLSTGK
ncbi:LamG domain-containing protein [Mucilaginibacter mali]|uniref:LamG domain-containing protein n=1 Tax=Mucilaginibacter mali TaxID=2740462 RepID=A0A7D4PV15_9SPHI|nr:LamG domain-containing protein [Mucilaginibacter mali]QKJ30723.1 LamG domain-containing protein [Mucilaginibacter mali]